MRDSNRFFGLGDSYFESSSDMLIFVLSSELLRVKEDGALKSWNCDVDVELSLLILFFIPRRKRGFEEKAEELRHERSV